MDFIIFHLSMQEDFILPPRCESPGYGYALFYCYGCIHISAFRAG